MVLVALGSLLIALFVAGLVIARTTGSETTTTAPAGRPGSTSATAAVHTQAAATSTTTTTKSTPTEAELLALLGTGVVLVLAGALYSRLSAIKLPGGAEIDLTPEEKTAVAHEVATQAARVAKTTSPNHEQLAQTTADALDAALDSARLMKLRAGGTLDTNAIQHSAQLGLQLAAAPPRSASA